MRMTGDIISQIEQTQQLLRESIEQSKLQPAKSDELIKSCRCGKPEGDPPAEAGPDSASFQS